MKTKILAFKYISTLSLKSVFKISAAKRNNFFNYYFAAFYQDSRSSQKAKIYLDQYVCFTEEMGDV